MFGAGHDGTRHVAAKVEDKLLRAAAWSSRK
jgi:hypothetical protein